MKALCVALCVLWLSAVNTSRGEPAPLLHVEPETAGREREAKDDPALARWKATVKERTNPELIAGLDSDEFNEREASSFEAGRRALAGVLPLRELIDASPGNASPEVRRRIQEILERALGEEKSLRQLLDLAAAKDTAAETKRRIEELLDKVPRLEWKPLLTRLRKAVAKKMPPRGAPGDLLEKILVAIPEGDRRQMVKDVFAFAQPGAKEEDRRQHIARTKAAILAAAKNGGLEAAERPVGNPAFEMMQIALKDPKDKTGVTYLLDITPRADISGSIRVRTEIPLTRDDIVKGPVKLPSGEWGTEALPEKVPILSDQLATGTPGFTTRLFEQELEAVFSGNEFQWFKQHFPKHEDAIMEAFGLERI